MSLDDMKVLLQGTHVEKPIGKPEAILVVFSDLECPFCSQFFSNTLAPIEKDTNSHIAIAYKQFPLDMHEHAYDWALESECVAKKFGNAAFFSYVHARYTLGDVPLSQVYPALTSEQLNVCRTDTSITDRIEADKTLGSDTFNITGTPTTVVLNPTSGYYEVVTGALPSTDFSDVITRVEKN